MRYHKLSGISLVEVLIALVILGVGLMGVGSFQASVTRSSVNALQRTEAVINAQSKIESLRQNSVSSVSSGEDEIDSGTTKFTRQWQTYQIGSDELMVISQVEWPDIDQSAKTGVLQSSENTKIAVASVLSTQHYSDSSLWFKANHKDFVTIAFSPGASEKAKTMCAKRKNNKK